MLFRSHVFEPVGEIAVEDRAIDARIAEKSVAAADLVIDGPLRFRGRIGKRRAETRAEAFDLMLQHAGDLGANAVVGARYDATEVMQGVTEVLAYGTAVIVEPAKG